MLHKVPSLEMMTLQKDSFAKDLREALAMIQADPDLKTKTIVDSKLETIIFKRLGLSIEFEVLKTPFANGGVILPPIDSNHVFIRPFTQYAPNDIGNVISYFDKDRSRIGLIDMEKVRVGGVFSNIPIKLYLTHGMFNRKFTPDEITSIMLHELGHAYTYFYYLHYTAMGSFISIATAAAAVGAKSDKERYTIIEKGSRILGIDGVPIRELSQYNEKQLGETLQALYIDHTKTNLRSETGAGIYEVKACEQLADWFMSKFSTDAAIHQAVALEKMYRHGWAIAVETYRSGKYASKLAAMTAQYAASAMRKTASAIICNAILYDDTYDVYDKPSERVTMLRNSIVDSLKDSRLDAKTVKELTATADSLKTVASRMKEFDDTPGSIVKWLREVVIRDYRNKSNAIKLQKNIEELMYNDAFISAAKLRGLSK